MLTVTVRFYVTIGGFVAVIALLSRISWTLGKFRQEFTDHIKADEAAFGRIDADIRELRVKRR